MAERSPSVAQRGRRTTRRPRSTSSTSHRRRAADRRRRRGVGERRPADARRRTGSTPPTPTAGSRSSGCRPTARERRVLTTGRARARRAVRRPGLRRTAVARRRPLRPHRRPRRPHRPRRRAVEATARRPSAGAAGRRRTRRPSSPRPRVRSSTRGRASGVPFGWTSDGAWIAAVGESETAPQDLWLLPVPGVAPAGVAAAPGHELDAGGRRGGVRRRAAQTGRAVHADRPRRARGRGHALAAGRRDRQAAARRSVPVVLYPHGGPTWQAYRGVRPVQAAARPTRASRSSTSTSAARPATAARSGWRTIDEWGHADALRHDRRGPLGGGAAVVRRAARDLRRLVRRLPRPLRPRRGAGLCGGRASTCTATPRSPRASATATGPGRLDSAARWARRTTRSGPRCTAAARRSIAPSGSRRRC